MTERLQEWLLTGVGTFSAQFLPALKLYSVVLKPHDSKVEYAGVADTIGEAVDDVLTQWEQFGEVDGVQ